MNLRMLSIAMAYAMITAVFLAAVIIVVVVLRACWLLWIGTVALVKTRL